MGIDFLDEMRVEELFAHKFFPDLPEVAEGLSVFFIVFLKCLYT